MTGHATGNEPTDTAAAAEDATWFVRGYAEPHALLLKAPPAGLRVFKVLSLENLIRSVEGRYLHFNRVDGYSDFPGADADDGAQLPEDAPGNEAITFEKRPDFSVSDYYASARRRTYACCFSAGNSPHIWEHYGNGGSKGKIALVINAEKLRARLNATVAGAGSALMHGDAVCRPIFSTNYGMIEYVDRASYRENADVLPNPIRYTFLKGRSFDKEDEFRASLSALGMGRFQLADGSELPFPVSLQVEFDFRDALPDGTIEAVLLSPGVDLAQLRSALLTLGIRAILQQPWEGPPSPPDATGIVTRRAETTDSGQSLEPDRGSGSR